MVSKSTEQSKLTGKMSCCFINRLEVSGLLSWSAWMVVITHDSQMQHLRWSTTGTALTPASCSSVCSLHSEPASEPLYAARLVERRRCAPFLRRKAHTDESMRFSLACQSASGMPAQRSTSSRFSGARPRITARTSSSALPIVASAAMFSALASVCTPHERRHGMLQGLRYARGQNSQSGPELRLHLNLYHAARHMQTCNWSAWLRPRGDCDINSHGEISARPKSSGANSCWSLQCARTLSFLW